MSSSSRLFKKVTPALLSNFNYTFAALKGKIYISWLIIVFSLQLFLPKFSTMLKTKLYLGGTYQALSWLNCGALLRGGFYGSYFDPAFTLSANATPFRALAFTLTYSIYNRSMNNFGAGIIIGGKPIQFYIVTDNILSRMVNLKSDSGSSVGIPGYTRSFNCQFGINLQFGSRAKKKEAAPQPGS